MHLRIYLLLLSLLLLAACQPDGTADSFSRFFLPLPTPSIAPVIEPSPTFIQLALPEPTAALPPTAPPPARAWLWQPVASLPVEHVRDVYYTGELLTWTQKVWKTATAANDIQYVLHGEKKEVLYEAPGNSKIEMARMAGRRLALLETAPNQPAIIRLFDLGSGDEWFIGARDGEFTNPKYPPHLSIDADHLVWNSMKLDGRTCLRMYTFQDGSFTDLLCTERSMNYLRARMLRWPVVIYDRSISGKEVAFSTHGIFRHTGPISELNCTSGEDADDGLVLGCLGKDPEPGSGIPTGGLEALAFDPTLQVCGGLAFWISDGAQVRSWTPGASAGVIYRTMGETERIQAIQCADNWITLALTGTTTDQKNLDIWAAPIEEWAERSFSPDGSTSIKSVFAERAN